MQPELPFHRRIEPARLLTDLNHAAKVWFGLFLLVTLALLISLFVSLRPRAVPIDGAFVIADDGWPYWAKRMDWGAVTNLHVHMAEEATQAFLLRNPAGFDAPERVELLFLPEAAAEARRLCESERQERQAKELHEKPEGFSTQFLRLSNERIRVSVRGQLIRSGLFRGQPIVEAVPFQFDIELIPNPNLALNGLIPLVVNYFHYEALHP